MHMYDGYVPHNDVIKNILEQNVNNKDNYIINTCILLLEDCYEPRVGGLWG